VTIVGVAVDPPDKLEVMRSAAAASFDFISDPDGRLLDLLEVRHSGGHPESGGDIAQSASFLVDAEGRLLWQAIAENYRVRPSVDDVLAAIDAQDGPATR
jgi:peroxiredoxin